jgi:hypothetical protein
MDRLNRAQDFANLFFWRRRAALFWSVSTSIALKTPNGGPLDGNFNQSATKIGKNIRILNIIFISRI